MNCLCRCEKHSADVSFVFSCPQSLTVQIDKCSFINVFIKIFVLLRSKACHDSLIFSSQLDLHPLSLVARCRRCETALIPDDVEHLIRLHRPYLDRRQAPINASDIRRQVAHAMT